MGLPNKFWLKNFDLTHLYHTSCMWKTDSLVSTDRIKELMPQTQNKQEE